MTDDFNDLFRWVDEHEISRTKKNLHRDFSDALPLVEILKHHYPKLVDLHNYTAKNALHLKVLNWEMLNRKTLNKLKINLTRHEQEELAKATPGAIESLLQKIKDKTDKLEAKQKVEGEPVKVYYLEGISNEEHVEDVLDIKIRTGKTTSSQKLMSSDAFTKMEAELADRAEEVGALKAQIEHLEKMVAIKEERITDLTNQLQKLINCDGDSGCQGGRFFNRIF